MPKFKITDEPCLNTSMAPHHRFWLRTRYYLSGTIPTCDGYMFYDSLHPSTKTHEYLNVEV